MRVLTYFSFLFLFGIMSNWTYLYASNSLQDALLAVSNSIDKRSNYGSNKKLVNQNSNADRVTVFTQEDIEKFDSIYSLLNTASGVVVDEGYFGKHYINIRASNGALYNNRIQLLVNGFRVNDSLVQDFMIQSIPKESIQKIELIRGPASALYGSGAYSGIINIITYQANHYDQSTLQLTQGNAGQNGLKFRLSNSQHKLKTMFSFDLSRANGVDRNQRIRNPLKITASIPDRKNQPRFVPIATLNHPSQYKQNDQNKTALAFMSYGNFKLTMAYSDIFSNRSYVNLNNLRLRVGNRNLIIPRGSLIQENSFYGMKFIGMNWSDHLNRKTHLKISTKFQQNSSDLLSFDNVLFDSFSNSIEKQIEVQLNYQVSKKWDIVLGMNKDFNRFSQYIKIPIARVGLIDYYNIVPRKESLFGAYVQASYQYNQKLKLVWSARYDTHEFLKSSKSPKFSITYQLAQQEYLKLTWGKSFRYPNAIDLFQRSNIRLDPRFEQQISKEITWSKEMNDRSNLSITLFDLRHLHNRSEIRRIAANVSSKSSTKGIEAEFKSAFSKNVSYYMNVTLLDSLDNVNREQAAN
ncbi:TonB-dependent receptor, partial [bacterium]|nr:TonB-dependent receptor [bacterium]